MQLARRGDIVQITTLTVTPTQDAAVIRTSIQKITSACKVCKPGQNIFTLHYLFKFQRISSCNDNVFKIIF